MFGVGGRGLGAIVRAHMRVCLAGSGRCYLECTVGGPVVYMGRDREGAWGQTKKGVRGGVHGMVLLVWYGRCL